MFTKIAVILSDTVENSIFAIPALRGIRSRYPNSEVHVLLNVDAQGVLPSFDMANSVHLFDPVAIKSASGSEGASVEAILENHLGLATSSCDHVINLNGSDLSALITTFLASGTVIGAHFGKSGEIEISGEWAQYAYANVGTTIVNPFHMADLYKYTANVQGEEAGVDLRYEATDSEVVQKATPAEKGLRFGLVLNEQVVRESYLLITAEILKKFPRATICLMPASLTEADLKCARSVAADIQKNVLDDGGRILNATEISTQAELMQLADTRHLVAGPMSLATHFSAGVGTFSIVIAKSDQALFERGPYGHGHVVFVDENQDAPTYTINPEMILGAIELATVSGSGKLPNSEAWKMYWKANNTVLPNSFKVFVTERVVFHQQDGIERTDLIYEPVFSRGSTLQECLISFYRLIWQFDLNQSEDVIPDLIISRIDTVKGMVNLLDTLEKIFRLAEFGQKYSLFVNDSLRRNDLKQANEDSSHLTEIDNLIYAMGKQIPAVAPICRFYNLHQFENRASDPQLVAEAAILAYERLQAHASIIVDLVNDLIVRTDKKMSLKKNEESRVDG